MVSRKCTCQLSSGHTLRSAAAIPPSAMTVWALPRSDLQTMAVRTPWVAASMAARRPAPPAPITTTSYSWTSCWVRPFMLLPSLPFDRTAFGLWPRSEDDAEVPDDPHRHQADVEISQADAEEREPREGRVPLVQPGDELPQGVTGRRLRELVHRSAAEVAAAVTRERVAGEEKHVQAHHECADSDAEPASREAEREQRVVGQDGDEEHG